MQVRLCPYNPLWRLQYWLEAACLRLNLNCRILGIAHVGSTAIPGMPAKPIIDISLAVADYELAWELVTVLKGLGYHYLGEYSAWREYSFEKRRPFACALFITEPNGEKWQARLRFRDHLRTHPEARRAYADLKLRLAQQYIGDLLAYQRAKLPFIEQILTEAI